MKYLTYAGWDHDTRVGSDTFVGKFLLEDARELQKSVNYDWVQCVEFRHGIPVVVHEYTTHPIFSCKAWMERV